MLYLSVHPSSSGPTPFPDLPLLVVAQEDSTPVGFGQAGEQVNRDQQQVEIAVEWFVVGHGRIIKANERRAIETADASPLG
jgi:hypothetical protein